MASSPTTPADAETRRGACRVRSGRPRWRRRRRRILVVLCLLAGLPLVPEAAGTVPVAQAVAARDAGAEAGSWLWPVSTPVVQEGFLAPATRYGAGHRGIDITAHVGDAVVAPTAGVLRFNGRVVDRDVVTLAVGRDLLVSLEPVTGTGEVGDTVAAGERIGTVSSGGHCDGCVHIGVREEGEYISPLLFFAGVPRAVLLPLHP